MEGVYMGPQNSGDRHCCHILLLGHLSCYASVLGDFKQTAFLYCNMYTNWIHYNSISARINNFTPAVLDKLTFHGARSRFFGEFVVGHNDLTKLTFALWRSIWPFLKIWYNHFLCEGAGTRPLYPPPLISDLINVLDFINTLAIYMAKN